MATLDFPNVIPSSMQFGIRFNTSINVSPLSGVVQTIELPGARWAGSISFDDMEAAESRLLSSFLAQLRGASGRFKIKDFTHPTPRGSNDGSTITVDGSSQTGSLINTTGWTANATGVLLEGDYIQLEGNELKIITADVDADSNGDATINIEPPIRTSPNADSTIITTDCETIVLLNSDDYFWSSNDAGQITNISFDFTEGF